MGLRVTLRRRLRVAPLRVRLLAALIDAGIGIAAVALGVGLIVLGALSPKVRHAVGRLTRCWPGDVTSGAPGQTRRPTRRVQVVVWGIGLIGSVWGRNRPSRGRRAMGLRRVELSTGRPVGVRTALVQFLATTAWNRLVGLPFRPMDRRRSERMKALQAEVAEVQRAHPHDASARNAAALGLYRERGMNPFASCGWALARALLTQAPILVTKRHQNVADLIAGVVVVQERPRRVGWLEALRRARGNQRAR